MGDGVSGGLVFGGLVSGAAVTTLRASIESARTAA
jgi:hypothetical protein